MLRRFPIVYRIVFLVVILGLTVFVSAGGFYLAIMDLRDFTVHRVASTMLDGHKDKIRVATHSMAVSMGAAIRGLSDTQAIDKLCELTADVRFEDDASGYFFVYDQTIAVSVPAKRSNEGKDLVDTQDRDGVYFVRELAKQAAAGGGFVEYVFAKPDKGDQPKLAYAEMIPGTRFWIGTGVYVDNVQDERMLVSTEISNTVRSKIVNVMLAVFVILLGVFTASIAIVRSIVRPLHGATEAARSIAEGNLAVSIDTSGQDEAAHLQVALQQMATKLRDNLAVIQTRTQEAEEKAAAAQAATEEAREARTKAEQARTEGMHHAALRLEQIVGLLAEASGQIATQAQAVLEGSDAQKERLQSTATAMEEMNATVLEVARNASYAAKSSQEASQKARDGSEVVHLSIDAMSKTQAQTEGLRTSMSALGQQTQSIGAIMSVITDIADQTNLLALNAAIEAARAGEAGRGFAVVADEVRKLAEKTMSATKEVGDAIAAIQRVATSNIQAVEAAVADLEQAAKHSEQSGVVLNEIVAGAESSADQIRGIATAAEEQSASSEEINSALEAINEITEDTARKIQESTQALHGLAQQTQELRSLIDELKSQGA